VERRKFCRSTVHRVEECVGAEKLPCSHPEYASASRLRGLCPSLGSRNSAVHHQRSAGSAGLPREASASRREGSEVPVDGNDVRVSRGDPCKLRGPDVAAPPRASATAFRSASLISSGWQSYRCHRGVWRPQEDHGAILRDQSRLRALAEWARVAQSRDRSTPRKYDNKPAPPENTRCNCAATIRS
jgi:hypothetical protein